MANGQDILDEVVKDLDDAMENTSSRTEEAILRALRYIIPFIKQSQTDHDKVDKLWTAYSIWKWGAIVIGATVLGDFAIRLITLIDRFGVGS